MSATPASPAAPCAFEGFSKDAQGCYPLGALIVGTEDCALPEGACFTSSGVAADEPPPPEPKRKTKRKPAMSDPAPTPSKAASDRADEATIPDFKALDARRITVDVVDDAPATTAAPATQTAANELAGLVPKDGGSAITVMLALIAVAGGGAGWKFYQSFARQKHEQRMKELEIKEKKIELQDDKNEHKACEAARAADRSALEQKITALEARLVEAEKPKDTPASASSSASASPVELPFDPEELNDRIEQIERALKKAPSEKKPSDKKVKKDAKDAKKDA